MTASAPASQVGQNLLDALDARDDGWLTDESKQGFLAARTIVEVWVPLVEQEIREAERKRLAEYVTHTRDSHGYPCPVSISKAEYADGIRCICGLDQPKRYMDKGWRQKYGNG